MTNHGSSNAAVRIALLTPPGRGALAVVGVAGSGACGLMDACFRPRGAQPLSARSDAAICFGQWVSAAGGLGEELVVVRHSADRLEVHCHGGHAASEAVLTSLENAGAVRQAWPEWLEGSGLDPIEVEAREALCHVAGARAARILVRQAAGLLGADITRLASLPPADRAFGVARLLAAARVGVRLVDPWRVVLAGPVNAGKSSLVNALAGHARSIVSPEPGTTRDLVTTRLVLGGWEVELVDTAGLREPHAPTSSTEQAGIARALGAVAAADLVLRVVPADAPVSLPLSAEAGSLTVLSKADRASPSTTIPKGSILTSAIEGQGIAELADAIVARLVPEDASLLDGPVPFTPRQVALIRELTA